MLAEVIETKETAILKLEGVVAQLKKEKQEIIKACAHFGLYLKKYSIMPYNDAVEKYISMMIGTVEVRKMKNKFYGTGPFTLPYKTM